MGYRKLFTTCQPLSLVQIHFSLIHTFCPHIRRSTFPQTARRSQYPLSTSSNFLHQHQHRSKKSAFNTRRTRRSSSQKRPYPSSYRWLQSELRAKEKLSEEKYQINRDNASRNLEDVSTLTNSIYPPKPNAISI